MPKKRILPYIILGILDQNPGLTGKFITNQFKNEIGEFWKASHSQIYPELKKMVEDDWIKQTSDSNNEKEKYYHLTNLGKEKLNSWIDIPINALPVVEDLFSLKLFFIQDPNDPRISTLVNKQLDLLEKQLDHLNDREKILFDTQEKRNKNYGHYLILERAISRLDNQIKWLKTIKQR
ncbi:MAG TPA: PadR family transcriptional regulator [Candidatus Companilactobacillus pullicola]|uniref:PadR family transcriptional regulator n=1 Tax=Candidatus Companilactobacillus pullicola TaxID=2838523 RepID=A0A9D1ZKA0_9LACO|nr:PadR family transcriptional regulator [Lactobacillus johnsonii]MBZ4028864.1 PadR family transcriptional regulator [Lactobacillus johnsonii]HIY91716.1 PadR family transcriptional regulator [Candidatus Companilactobacillus pullicola]